MPKHLTHRELSCLPTGKAGLPTGKAGLPTGKAGEPDIEEWLDATPAYRQGRA